MHWQSTQCSPLIVQLTVLTYPEWNNLLFTAWPSLLPSWHCAKLQVKKLETATSSGESQKFRPSESLILTMQRVNCINLDCILDSCTISASYEVSEAQKALFLPALKKDLACLRKSTMPTSRTQLTAMTFLNTRDPVWCWRLTKHPERNLSCLWAPSLLLSFYLRSGFTPRFTLFNSLLSFCHMAVSLLAFGWK